MAHQLILGSKTLALAVAVVILLPPAECQQQSLPTSISIIDIRGDGATGRVGQRSSESPSVRVVDEKDAPIAGAVVVFTTPTEGSTATFSNGGKTLTMVTDAHGYAVAQGLRFNALPGKVQIHVNASYKGLTARANITQQSEAPAGYKPPRRGGGKVIAVIAVLAGGAAAGAVVATRNGGSTSTTNTPPAPAAIGITPGTGTIVPPR